jgi:diguanylate cyclase (GGDEF)-like protein
MDAANYPQSFFRIVAWATLLIVLGAIVMFQWLPIPEWRRWTLDGLLVLMAFFAFAMQRYIIPRYWPRGWIVYSGILAYSAALGLADYLLEMADLSPLYSVVVIVTAMSSNRRAAFFAAALASVLRLTVTLAHGIEFITGILETAVRTAVYFLAALLVSELSAALTERWRAVAAEAEQQRQEIARRKDDLEGLYEISQVFGNLEDARETFRQVSERIARLLGAEMCMLARFDENGAVVRGVPPGYGLSDEQIARLTYVVDAEMIAFWDVAQREYLLLNDLTHLPPALAGFVLPLHLREVVAARMMWRGRPIGLIFAANKTNGGSFEEKDARLLGILAGQVAIAVENARLYREAQKNLQDVMRLYAISTQLVAQSDPETIPTRVVKAIAEALNAPMATIALLNEATGLLEYSATVGVPEDALKVPFRKEGLGMTVVRTGEPRFIEDIRSVSDISPVSRVWGYRAVACLPIQHSDKRVGALYVNYSEPHTFTPIEKNMLAIFANQTAIALENARLQREEQRQAMELATLANLSHSLQETMDLEEMFRVLERQMCASLPAADAGALLVYDHQNDVLVPRAVFGFDREVLQKAALRPGESIPGQVFQLNRAMLVSGNESVEEARQTMRPHNQALFAAAHLGLHPQSVICAPLRTGGETLGVILLDNFKSPQAFAPEDLRLVDAMADRAALAIRNAQLFARGLRRAAQLAAVAEVGHRVTAILDLDELATTLVGLIRSTFGYRYAHLFINDPVRRETVLRAGAGPATETTGPESFALKFDQGIVGWVASHGERLLANDVAQEPRYLYHPLLPDARAELAAPLKAGPRVIGVLDVQSENINAFEPSDIATLETLAGQVAIAIENARLYGEMQEQARRDSLTQAYNHGYFLKRLDEEVRRAQRESHPLSLIMLDIDYFKEYNDRYGHVVGDQVLGTVVQAIGAHIKHTDLVGRWGGEEFGIALVGADVERARIVAGRIRKTLAETQLLSTDGRAITPPSVSQGLATLPTHARDTAALVDLADAALYRAKSRGRDQICSVI